MIARALLSTYDKTGLVEFARGLEALGVELVASGGTAELLEEAAFEVTRVEELTEVPELLGGRVKTLHPRIHAGILARPDRDDDLDELDEHEIRPFDLVCVNLYPFARAARSGVARAEALELIDVGGPSLLRAAAKNHAHVAPVSSPNQYARVLAELEGAGKLSATTRRRLAAEAFATTAAYDAAIAGWFADAQQDALPERLVLGLEKVLDLAYGENPHQRGAFYAESHRSGHLLSGVEQLHGRELSLINLYDLAAGRALLEELDGPACVIVKHGNPCGAAVAGSVEAAYRGALACDPVSAFGMVCALNRPVTSALADELAARFVDVLYAPGYADGALSRLTAKPATRILRAGVPVDSAARWDYKRVPGGFLVQDSDERDSRADMHVVAGAPSETAWRDLRFAWQVCKHVTSNAIVLAKDGRTIGIGSGQVSRVDAVRIALEKARRHGHDLTGAALASDAFFPFADGPGLALEAGIAAVIQPGGSKRDADVVAAVESAGAAMVFTGRRHFRH